MVIPSICESDFKELVRKLALVIPYVEWVQIVVSDATLYPVKTVIDGLDKILAAFPEKKFEAHILSSKPEGYLEKLVLAGFHRVIAHVECTDPREFLADARTHSLEVGLALDTGTPVEDIEPFLEEIDCVEVMTTDAGTLAGEFQEEQLEKVKAIHRNFPDLPVAVSGGINKETVKYAVEAGATGIVATTYIFKDEDAIASSLQELQVAG